MLDYFIQKTPIIRHNKTTKSQLCQQMIKLRSNLEILVRKVHLVLEMIEIRYTLSKNKIVYLNPSRKA